MIEYLLGDECQTVGSKSKAIICRQLAMTDKCLVDGADETLQMLNFAAVTMQALHAN
jgi:hypothetical protein